MGSKPMARSLRIEKETGVYHMINRGNYRQDLFINGGENMTWEEFELVISTGSAHSINRTNDLIDDRASHELLPKTHGTCVPV